MVYKSTDKSAKKRLPRYLPLCYDCNQMIVNNNKHIDVEVGCGVGWHSIVYAKNNPDRYLFAIERTRTKFTKFKRRLEQNNTIENLSGIHADAVRWITENLRPQSISRLIVLYPNPYPKTKHANLRWAHLKSWPKILACLTEEAEIQFATNLLWYADELRCHLPQKYGLTLKQFSILDKDFVPRTHFEKKYLLRNELCYDLRFIKSA